MSGTRRGADVSTMVGLRVAVALAVALALGLALGLALWARHGWVQSPEMAWACQAGTGPEWSCWGRDAVIAAFSHHRLGLLSCATAVVALMWGRLGVHWSVRGQVGMAAAAMCIAMAGMVLYDADLSAIGFVAGVVVLLSAAPGSNRLDRPARPDLAP